MTVDRLFTGSELEAMLEAAHSHGMQAGEDDDCPEPPMTLEAASAAAHELLGRPLTFPPDEPLFVLRGSDPVAPDALSDGPICYEDECQVADYPETYLEQVRETARDMRDWQREHPDRVKVPSR